MPKLMVVVPALNEKGNIEKVIYELKHLSIPHLSVDFVIVDDGSVDCTGEIARSYGAKVISLPYNMGIGVAVQTGFKYALSVNADFVAQVDGDGQHVASELNKLLPVLSNHEADVVIGTRFKEKVTIGIMSTTPLRWFVGRLLALTVQFLTGQKLTDTTSGFRVYNKKSAQFIAHEYPDDYPEVEVLVILAQHGFKLMEVPVQMRKRVFGQSSISWSRSIYYVFKVAFASFVDKLRTRKKHV